MLRDVGDREKEQQLLKRFENYAAGFYFDCTRDNLTELINNIYSSTVKSRNYDKFISAISNVLFKKVYIEGECLKPKLILGLIDILLDVFDIQEVKTGFMPANAMLGEVTTDTGSIRDRIIEQFNRNVESFDDDEVRECKITVNGK